MNVYIVYAQGENPLYDDDILDAITGTAANGGRMMSILFANEEVIEEIVSVIRCARCRYWHRYSSSSRKGRCNGLILYLNGELETPEDFFCADGEDR